MFYPHIAAPYRNRKWLALAGWWCFLSLLVVGSNRTRGEALASGLLTTLGVHFFARVRRSPAAEPVRAWRLFGLTSCVMLGLYALLRRQPLLIGSPPTRPSMEQLERAMSQRPWMGAL